MAFRQIIRIPVRILTAPRASVQAHSIQSIRLLSTTQPLGSKDRPKTTEGLSPKILNENPPKDEDQSEDVQKHNKEMSEMSGKANSQIRNEDAYKDKESPEAGQEKVKKDKTY